MPTLELLKASLCVGVDVSKASHVAAFLSESLLAQRKRWSNSPTLCFAQNRSGIDAFLKAIRLYGSRPEHTAVLLEQTGHYHRALAEVLQAEGLQVYVIAIHQKKLPSREKTDKRDALRLANLLYSQLVLGAQADDSTQQIRRLLPPVPVAARVAPLVRMHYELTQQHTRLLNKLTALCDEIFPELCQVVRDPNLRFALDLRERFPTPDLIARATFSELQALKHGHKPTDQKLLELQELARHSIGLKEEHRLRGLLLEQSQLIASLRLVAEQRSVVDQQVHEHIERSREGQILLSLPGIAALDAAGFLAVIGNIRNFERASQLRRFLGWAPQAWQTGVSFDKDSQTSAGSRLGKQHLYMLSIRATRFEPWKSFYERLVEKKCPYDPRTRRYRGKMKVIGRLAGTIAGMIFAFLASDASLVDATPPGQEPPPPRLYDAEIHQAHRRGEKGKQTRSA